MKGYFMNESIQTTNVIDITEKAVNEINRIKEENKISAEHGLRIGVKGGGCSGFQYQLGFDTFISEDDTVLEKDGIKLFIDGKSLFYLTGTVLDFSDGLNGRGFVFNNPNAVKTCGCGDSFGV
jgi:iron-sulfur cluster assembly protein